MIQSYFKIALRNVLKNKTFSFINIFGLATGLTACVLILMYVIDESSYDRHHIAGYFIVNKWLQSFAYRQPIEWWVFILVGLTALLVALLTISFQTIRAATAYPVSSLRSE